MNRALLQQALDALEPLVPDPENDFGPKYAYDKKQQKLAIKALKAELAKPEYQPIIPKCRCCGTTENLHVDVGSGGPYRCSSPDCMVF